MRPHLPKNLLVRLQAEGRRRLFRKRVNCFVAEKIAWGCMAALGSGRLRVAHSAVLSSARKTDAQPFTLASMNS
jgi:hypothetical protein